MEDATAVSWIAIIVAAVVKFAIGAAWYSPALFGKQWQVAANVEPDPSAMMKAIPAQVIGDLIMAYVLARFIGHYAADGLVAGAFIGFMAWLGFVATVMIGPIFYEKRPMGLFTINAGYQLVGIVVMGAIIGLI